MFTTASRVIGRQVLLRQAQRTCEQHVRLLPQCCRRRGVQTQAVAGPATETAAEAEGEEALLELSPGAYQASIAGRADKLLRDNSVAYTPLPEGEEVLEGVPTIDCDAVLRHTDAIDCGDPAQRAVVETVAAACREWGFFNLANHGVETQLLADFITAAETMFALPREAKHKFLRTESNSRGFFEDEKTKQTLDWKQGFDFGHTPRADLPPDHPSNQVLDGFNQWPEELPEARRAMEAYCDRMAVLCSRIMQVIAVGLGQEEAYFDAFFAPHTSYQRINYYPVCPRPSDFLAVNRHKDAGALTALLQDDVAALQVNKDGKWVGVEPVAGTYTMNVGDMLQVWTNGLYVAPEHRVLARGDKERFSAPFFYNPSYYARVAPMPACMGEQGVRLGAQREAVYKPIPWGLFRQRRFEGDYADVGREIQISDFLVEAS